MSITAAMGVAQGINAREAAVAAAQQALSQMSGVRPAAALVFVAHEFNPADSLSALENSLPNVPLWGFTTLAPIVTTGELPRSVMVLLLGGPDMRAACHWLPEYSQNSANAAKALAQALTQDRNNIQSVLLAADGINGDLNAIINALQPLKVGMTGCMASSDASSVKSYQISGAQSGSGGLAVMTFGGKLRMGLAFAHAWKKTGIYYRVTQTRGAWIQALDDQSPAEVYGKAFHYSAREWGFPPLKNMVRQFPLGLETATGGEMLLHAPLHVEVDGSLRLNHPLPAGQVVHLTFGDPDDAIRFAGDAARKALSALGTAKPLVTIVFVDEAYRMLLQSHPDELYDAVRAELGSLPLAIIYTLGQVVRRLDGYAAVTNNSINVIVLGEEN